MEIGSKWRGGLEDGMEDGMKDGWKDERMMMAA